MNYYRDPKELYNIKNMIHDIRTATEKYEKKPSTLIHNYKPPDDCVTCPFFKVNVANAENQASLKCQLLGAEMSLDEIPYLRERRDPLCPMEEVEC